MSAFLDKRYRVFLDVDLNDTTVEARLLGDFATQREARDFADLVEATAPEPGADDNVEPKEGETP